MNAAIFAAALLPALSFPLFAGTRVAGSFAVPAESLAAGGGCSAGGTFANCGSIGEIGGLSLAAGQGLTAKQGFPGMLYDVAGLAPAAGLSIREIGSRPLPAALVMDDGSLEPLAPAALIWSASPAALLSISDRGLATASSVYADTVVTVRGQYGPFLMTLPVTILNAGIDDYQIYAGDGLDDAWQALHFGEENPDAFPGADPDADGQSNSFEYLAGLDPADHGSRFEFEFIPAAGGHRSLRFGPVVDGRSYTLMASNDLDLWDPVPDIKVLDESDLFRVIQDAEEEDPRRFYRIDISP